MPLDTLCKFYKKYKSKDGYSLITVNKKTYIAHKYFYEKAYGKLPEGKILDHLCRNRACINILHLEIVTNKENVQRGFSAKITTTIVQAIRKAYKKGQITQNELAQIYSLNQGHISKIINNRRWI